MSDDPYQTAVHKPSRALGILIFVLTFFPFVTALFYALYVLVFGDNFAIYILPIAVILASVLGGAAVFFYVRLSRRRGGALAWLMTLIFSWALSAIIYFTAIALDGIGN
jgi:uncharacterized membrane protein YGL010W